MPRSGRVRVPRPGPWAPTPPRRVAPGAGRRWAPRRTVPTRAGPPGRVGSRGHVPRDRKRGWGSQPQESFHLIGWVRFWYGGLGEIGQELLQLRGLIGAPSRSEERRVGKEWGLRRARSQSEETVVFVVQRVDVFARCNISRV